MRRYYVPCLYTGLQAKGTTGWDFQSTWVMAEHMPHSAGFLGWIMSFSACQSYNTEQ